jgi:ATP-dependent Clp protease ATP-binding subunit ClpX
MDTRSVGFHSPSVDKTIVENPYRQVSTKDLIQYGLIPEFVGRFGLITNVDELTIENLVQVLDEPKNSIVKQYQYIFKLDGIELMFEKEALSQIAEKAKELKTNARGLKNIIEKILLPYQFEAMDLVERGLVKIIIDKNTVGGKGNALMEFNKKAVDTPAA